MERMQDYKYEDRTCGWDLVNQELAIYKYVTLKNGLGIPKLQLSYWPT